MANKYTKQVNEMANKYTKIAVVTGIIALIACVSFGIYCIANVNSSAHDINGSNARVYQHDANNTCDVYYFAYATSTDTSKFVTVQCNDWFKETFYHITWDDATLASKVGLTITQIKCANGSYRIIWGAMKCFGGEYAMFMNVDGMWYEAITTQQSVIGTCIQWAFVHA
jgi:hypothetical protein